jgi:hypothetical protein
MSKYIYQKFLLNCNYEDININDFPVKYGVASGEIEQIQTTDNIQLKVETIDIRSQIHIVRGKQVMLDSDLAMLYKVETGALNRAVKRNKK